MILYVNRIRVAQSKVATHRMQRLVVVFCALFCVSTCSGDCPSGCECFEASWTVKCISTSLREIPSDIPGYTSNLFITGNEIRRLNYNSFDGLKNVTNLVLSYNGIKEVASHSFSSLTMLRSLDLSGNQLSLIHPEAFSISGSPLQELNLSSCLYNHTSLTDLITALRWGGLGSLLRLDLAGNRLVLLPPGMFSPLPSLQRLFLGNNSLVAVYNGTFSGLERLVRLDLTRNAFRTFSAEGLRELERFERARLLLGENPYACSCETEEFADWLNSSRVQVGDSERVTCFSPPELRNAAVRALTAQALGCYGKPKEEGVADLTLQTSYVFLGLVLGFVGMVFLLVVYLNRHGIKKRVTDTHRACQDVLDAYQYRYEIDSDPRLRHISTNNHQQHHRHTAEPHTGRIPSDTCITPVPADITDITL
ncbi:trophoblast glycoprotein-like [Chanos chanos]|uniref:Trophoblast glycoprotein-like n=1 Tax=Chanos chanos TaxID=29144 RepID=A0A6J2WCW2_CHACN|nr:trophoblast glycoprotein-like [Chanos chanos]